MARRSALVLLAAIALLSTDVRAVTGQARPGVAAPADDYFAGRFRELSAELKHNIDSLRAASTLYRLESIEDDLPSLEPMAELLRWAADQSAAPGDVRALAGYLLADVDVSLGHVPEARQRLAALGFATSGWIVGGFDNEGGAGHDTVFGPEKGPVDLMAEYQGKERPIGWNIVPPLGPYPPIPVYDLIRPTQDVTFYFLTDLRAPAGGPARLSFGSSGTTKIWVNGQLVKEDPDDHPARFDQHSVTVPLNPGNNVVLVKVSTLAETPQLLLRVSREDGFPLDGASFEPPAPADPLPACDPASRPGPPDRADLATALEQETGVHPDDGQLLYDYATVLEARRSFDTKQQLARRTLERVVKLLPNDPRAEMLLAHTIQDDPNERRVALERTLQIDPTFAPARTQLAGYYGDHGFNHRAYDEAERAVADRPDYYPARIALAEADEALGLEARGQRLRLDLAKLFPGIPQVELSAARTERSVGRPLDAVDRYRRLLTSRFDDRDARDELLNMLIDAGDTDGVLALFQRGVDLSPTSVSTSQRYADFLSVNGHPGQALALYDGLVRQIPDEESVLEARGQHLLRQGDEKRALADFDRAIILKPQNPRLTELIHSLRPQEAFEKPYLRDAVALAKAAPADPPGPDDDLVILADVNVVRVYPNGLSSRVQQQVIRIYSDRAIDRVRSQSVRYVLGEQEVRIEQARTIKRDGTIVDNKSESDQSAGDSYGGMYFDPPRLRTVSFANLERGDTIEITYRRDDISQENMFSDYFGDLTPLQGTDVMKDVDYVLIAPASRTFYANQPSLPHVEHSVRKTKDGLQVQRWHVVDVPRIEPEQRMPGFTSVYAYLHVSTFKTWEDVGRWWWGLVHDQLHVTPRVHEAALEAVAGIPQSDVRGRVRAVYDYVVRKTRYIGLEFGIHGFKPYTVDEILAHLHGDCKDKASLMYAMLHDLGIHSNLVLLRMRFLGQVGEQPASLSVFNHAILYVPELNTFLDGTAEFSGSGELPDPDQGAQVLVVRDDGQPSKFFTTPMTSPSVNVNEGHYDLALSADGSAVIQGTTLVEGLAAQSLRRNYEAEAGRRERFEQTQASRYPGAKALSFEIGDPKAIEKPVETRYALRVPQLAQREGPAIVFSPLGQPLQYLQNFAAQSRRQFPIELGVPTTSRFHYVIHLPPGFSLAERTTTLDRSSAFGSYHYDLKSTATDVTLDGAVTFTTPRVAPADYQAFRAYLEDLDRTLSRRLHAVPVVEAAR